MAGVERQSNEIWEYNFVQPSRYLGHILTIFKDGVSKKEITRIYYFSFASKICFLFYKLIHIPRHLLFPFASSMHT